MYIRIVACCEFTQPVRHVYSLEKANAPPAHVEVPRVTAIVLTVQRILKLTANSLRFTGEMVLSHQLNLLCHQTAAAFDVEFELACNCPVYLH